MFNTKRAQLNAEELEKVAGGTKGGRNASG